MKLKEMPVKERPRERLFTVGKENLSDVEILSLIFRTGFKDGNAKDLAINILNEIKSIRKLATINKEALLKIKGIGGAKATSLLAAVELGKRIYAISDNDTKLKLNNSKKIYDNNKHLFIDKDQEYFYCLYLNNKKELIERKLLFMGTNNRSIVHPREIFKEAYLLSASSIVCMHNHPSGDVMPSNDDIVFTKALIDIGKLQQIPLVDHLIFGKDSYYSFFEDSDLMR